MRSISTTLAMDDSLNTHDHPFPLDPSLEHQIAHFLAPHTSYPASPFATPPSPAMDLQYILSPPIMLDGQQQQQQQQQQQRQAQPQLVFQHQHVPSQQQLQPPSQPVPSSSQIPPAPPPVHRRPSEHVHPNPDDAIITFDSKTRSFPKPAKPSSPSVADPYAEDFLRDVLGTEKWETFSSRLFERRLGGKAKNQGKNKSGDDDDAKSGVSAIEFLVKVEVVKEILRTYVPHPYNPLKSLTHPYPRAPSGQVTLTRSTVLLLSGWSNTQFSYWARRVEAVSVFTNDDSRLRAVGVALERRLRSPHLCASEDDGDNRDESSLITESSLVTGKGIDAIVDEVKKRTGKSPFIRGKHSSLDPFGTTVADLEPEHIPPPTQYAMPTFQAERYEHGTMRILDQELPPSMGPYPPPVSPPAPPKRRIMSSQAPQHDTPSSGAASAESRPVSHSSPFTPDHAPKTPARKPTAPSDNNVHHFPVSDSRSEVEAGGKRKPGEGDASSQKRARPF